MTEGCPQVPDGPTGFSNIHSDWSLVLYLVADVSSHRHCIHITGKRVRERVGEGEREGMREGGGGGGGGEGVRE